MAFGIASSLFKFAWIWIENKATVEKTFPEFWDHLEEKYGFKQAFKKL